MNKKGSQRKNKSLIQNSNDMKIPHTLQNGKAQTILQEATKRGIHFGINVLEYNENEGFIKVISDNEERFNIDIGLVILNKKPCAGALLEKIQHPLFASVLHEDKIKREKILYFTVEDLLGLQYSNEIGGYMVYRKEKRNNAILFEAIGREMRNGNIKKYHHYKKNDLDMIDTYISGKLLGYHVIDIFAFITILKKEKYYKTSDVKGTSVAQIIFNPDVLKKIKEEYGAEELLEYWYLDESTLSYLLTDGYNQLQEEFNYILSDMLMYVGLKS